MNDTPRVDWLTAIVWSALATVVLALSCGLLWLAGQVWRAVWPVVWPWVQAHSDGLAIGLTISVVLSVVVALIVEDGR